MNIQEVLEAWIIANNPSEKQIKLAELRSEICEDCDSRIKKLAYICKECKCPISKKVFTNKYNPCPFKKWAEVDDKHQFKDKIKKTLM